MYINETEQKISQKGLNKVKLVPQNSVLVSCTATLGKIAIAKSPLTTNQQINAVVCNDKILPCYFAYVMEKIGKNMQFLTNNVGVKHINQEMLNNIKIPLPPLDIQQKIVIEIEEIERKNNELNNQLQFYNKSIINIFDSSQKFQACKLGDVVTLEYGKALPKHNRKNGIYPVVGSNGLDGYHNEYMLQGPNIIVGRKGSVGKVNLIKENCTPIDTCFYVKIIDELVDFKYCYYLLKNLHLENLNVGMGPGGLNRNTAYNLNINLPPIKDQQKIVSYIEKLEKQIAEIQAIIDNSKQQKQKILDKYLK